MYANLCKVFSTVPGNTIKPINAINNINNSWLSLTVQLVKNTPAMQETPVRFLGREDPLEKGKANDSSILAWRCIVHGLTKSQTRLSNFHFKL